MGAPDLELARRFLAANPPPGPVILLAVAGSHQYGFDRPDSDLDLKGVHLAPEGQLLGLDPLTDAFDVQTSVDGVGVDLTTHEAGRALARLLKGDGTVLERLASPLQVLPGPHVDALQALVPGALSRAFGAHYAGFLKGCQREHSRHPRRKSWLYAVRVALSGVHLLETGQVEAHLPTLADRYGLPDVHREIEARRAHGDALDPDACAGLDAIWTPLDARLQRAIEGSVLPEHPPGRDALHQWLVQTRRDQLSRPGGITAGAASR